MHDVSFFVVMANPATLGQHCAGKQAGQPRIPVK